MGVIDGDADFGELAKEPMGKLFRWGLKHFCKPPFGAVVQLEAKAAVDNNEQTQFDYKLQYF